MIKHLKSAGLDNLHLWFLRQLTEENWAAEMVIFNTLENFQQFPEDWKKVNGMSVF